MGETVNRLRVLHIVDHFYPVLGYQETFLARAHSRTNVTLVITSDRYAQFLYAANRDLLKHRVVGSGYRIERGIRVLRLPALFDIPNIDSPWLVGLEKAVVNFKPDIVIVHGVFSITSIRIARLGSKLPNVRFVFDDHMTYNATRGGWTRLAYRILRKILTPVLLKKVDLFVAAVSDETRQFMEEIYGISASRIVVIPLGVDRSIFRFDSKSRDILRNKYKIEDSDIVFLHAGKIISKKGVHILVSAGVQICNKHPNVKLMIVGGGHQAYIEKLKETIRKSGFLKKFIFVKAVPNEELYQFFSTADVGVWPLQCSISMIEAMSCGLPIIISDRSGTVERVSEGTGLLYREGDPNDLRMKMEEMLDEKRRKNMSKNADKYTKQLSWDIIAEMFLDYTFSKKHEPRELQVT
jgi:glycosyltransferase involved in cell wall biosynthesis